MRTPAAITCPNCAYDLRRTAPVDGVVRCPECAFEIPERVPEMGWILACSSCGHALTGHPVELCRVTCPSCGFATRWPVAPKGSRASRRNDGRDFVLVAVMALAVLVGAPVVLFVFFALLWIFT